MRPSMFDPWIWRDPSALAGSYQPATPGTAPSPGRPDADEGPDAPGPGTPVDLVGYRVEAVDGGIGAVDEASDDAGAQWLVVDTGPWIFGRKVLLPVGTVARVDHLDRTVHLDRTREQVKDSPAYDRDAPDLPASRDLIGDYYADSYRRD